MIDKINDKRVFTELLEIFRNSEESIIKKIPIDFIRYVKENRDKTYVVNLIDGKSLNEQNILYETKKAISYIYKNYIMEDEPIFDIGSTVIKENMFENSTIVDNEVLNNYLVSYAPEKWYRKVFTKFISLFKR